MPTLQEVVGGTWKKEDELKQLKSEVATLERKIQLTLSSSQQQATENSGEKVQEGVLSPIPTENYNPNLSRLDKKSEPPIHVHNLVGSSTSVENRNNKGIRL